MDYYSRVQSWSEKKSSEFQLLKRETGHRIFVNRSLQLDRIKFYGFDMDYTLAQYKSPGYEGAAFKLMLHRLVEVGYPCEILKFQYDHTFPIRGLWFDKDRGCLLKLDSFGNLLSCLFGLTVVSSAELESWYENKFVQMSDRFYVYDTLFNLPEIYCLASIIEFFKSLPQASVERTGVVYKELNISFRSLFNDVRSAADHIHNDDSLKRQTVDNLAEFVHEDSELLELLEQLKVAGAKVFLLTNSEYWYTNAVMTYLLGLGWVNHFHYVLVNACKPKFFAEGTLLRVVDRSSGKLKLGTHTGPLQSGVVYSGGSCAVFSRLIGCRGKDVLYAGDHIFGDIIKSKKVGWRTLLIVPELANELFVWKQDQQLFERLQLLEASLGRMYLHLGRMSAPSVDEVHLAASLVADDDQNHFVPQLTEQPGDDEDEDDSDELN